MRFLKMDEVRKTLGDNPDTEERSATLHSEPDSISGRKHQKTYSAKTKRKSTHYPGVYSRQAERIRGVPDVCFDISYKDGRKKVWEKVGWESLGYTAKLTAKIRAEKIRALQIEGVLPQKKQKAPLFREVAGKYLEWAK
jgi:hypothetical protein